MIETIEENSTVHIQFQSYQITPMNDIIQYSLSFLRSQYERSQQENFTGHLIVTLALSNNKNETESLLNFPFYSKYDRFSPYSQKIPIYYHRPIYQTSYSIDLSFDTSESLCSKYVQLSYFIENPFNVLAIIIVKSIFVIILLFLLILYLRTFFKHSSSFHTPSFIYTFLFVLSCLSSSYPFYRFLFFNPSLFFQHILAFLEAFSQIILRFVSLYLFSSLQRNAVPSTLLNNFYTAFIICLFIFLVLDTIFTAERDTTFHYRRSQQKIVTIEIFCDFFVLFFVITNLFFHDKINGYKYLVYLSHYLVFLVLNTLSLCSENQNSLHNRQPWPLLVGYIPKCLYSIFLSVFHWPYRSDDAYLEDH